MTVSSGDNMQRTSDSLYLWHKKKYTSILCSDLRSEYSVFSVLCLFFILHVGTESFTMQLVLFLFFFLQKINAVFSFTYAQPIIIIIYISIIYGYIFGVSILKKNVTSVSATCTHLSSISLHCQCPFMNNDSSQLSTPFNSQQYSSLYYHFHTVLLHSITQTR